MILHTFSHACIYMYLNVYPGPLSIFGCYWVVWVPYIFWMLTSSNIYGLQIFSFILYVVFLPCSFIHCCKKAFWFDIISLVYFCGVFFFLPVLWCHIYEIIAKINVMKLFNYLYFLLGGLQFWILCLSLWSILSWSLCMV